MLYSLVDISCPLYITLRVCITADVNSYLKLGAMHASLWTPASEIKMLSRIQRLFTRPEIRYCDKCMHMLNLAQRVGYSKSKSQFYSSLAMLIRAHANACIVVASTT